MDQFGDRRLADRAHAIGDEGPLTRIQNHLFDLGGEICIPGHAAMTAGRAVSGRGVGH